MDGIDACTATRNKSGDRFGTSANLYTRKRLLEKLFRFLALSGARIPTPIQSTEVLDKKGENADIHSDKPFLPTTTTLI